MELADVLGYEIVWQKRRDAQRKKQTYLVAVFRSGSKGLRESVPDLLLHNKKVLTEQFISKG